MAHNLSKISSLLKKAKPFIEAGRERAKKAHYEKRATIREDARNPLKKKSPTKPVVRAPKAKAKPKVKAKTIHSPHTSKRGWDIKEMARERRKSLKLHNQKLRGKR